MWKFQYFSVIQILREINFGGSRSSETAVFAILEAQNSVDLVNFSLQKMQKFSKNQNSVSKITKMAFLELLGSQKLIFC